MRPATHSALSTQHPARRIRRGFNLIEMLIALSISGALMAAVMVALNASFTAYQTTTEVASTHSIGRLTMHRMLALIRMGDNFAPFPGDPLEEIVADDFIQFEDPDGKVIELRWDEDDEALYISVDGGTEYLLLEGVQAQFDGDGNKVYPFTMQYQKGRNLYRATIDLAIRPDDNMSVSLDGNNQDTIRLVASAMPRLAAYQ